MTGENKPHSKGFYYAYSLKSLTRLCDRLTRQRSFYLVKITNVLDYTFPEFKPFFNERLSKTALYLFDLRNYNEVLKNCQVGEPVFLTKNGKGKLVILDIEDYEKDRAEKSF